MEPENEMSVVDKTKDSSAMSKNSQVAKILKLIFDHPEAEKEIQDLLPNFWEKFESCTSEEEDFCESDVLTMYALNYVYNHNGPTSAMVSRSVFCYVKQLNLCRGDRNAMINCTKSCCKKVLLEFTNFESPGRQDILIDAIIKCLLGGNLGFSQFLVKFGLAEFPSENNEKSRKIVERLVKWFNSNYSSTVADNILEEERISIQFEDLLNQMEQNKCATFRRLTFILCAVCIIAEYREADEMGKRYNFSAFSEHVKWHCFRKLKCLYLFMRTTTESLITIKDINKFLSTIVNRQLSEATRTSLLETTGKMFCEMHNSYNPRSLQDLVRCKIRECLRNLAELPQSAYQLSVPVALKEFITFEEKEIWNNLKINQVIFYLEHKMCRGLQI